MHQIINVLVTTLPGLGLPKTLCLPLPAQLSLDDLLSLIATRVPAHAAQQLTLTTTSSRAINPSKTTLLTSLIGTDYASCSSPGLVSLRLSAPLLGGKGGFGSQLRAAGGRMSSRKRKQNAELATGSARNLDGRRLRTITEAKNLATYLATKPEMDRRQKEERRKRWEQVVEMAEQREADMRAGKGPDGRRKGLSEEWIEEKEEVGENVKNAVNLAMAAGLHDSGESNQSASDSAEELSDDDDDDPMQLDEEDMAKLTREAEAGDPDAIWVLKNKLRIPASLLPKHRVQHRFAGFDEDEDDDENDSSGNESDEANPKLEGPQTKGKDTA